MFAEDSDLFLIDTPFKLISQDVNIRDLAAKLLPSRIKNEQRTSTTTQTFLYEQWKTDKKSFEIANHARQNHDASLSSKEK